MCRIAGLVTGPDQPAPPLSALLYDPPHSLERQSYASCTQPGVAVNVDGTGVAWWADDAPEPLRIVSDHSPWADANLPFLAPRLRSRTQLAHVRSATPGIPHGTAYVAPFTHGHLAGTHNGWIGRFRERTARPLLELLSDGVFAAYHATTDSLVAFLLVVEHLRSEPDEGLAGAVRRTVEDVARVCRDADAQLMLNLLVADGEQIVATCGSLGRHANSLWTHLDEGTGTVRVASEPLDDADGWRQAAPDTLLVLTPGSVVVEPLPALASAGQAGPTHAAPSGWSAPPPLLVLDPPGDRREALAAHAREGLTAQPQRWLSPTYLYDARGSALFEEITQLEEYTPTRAETRLLTRHAEDIAAAVRPVELVELGSGSSTKTRLLLSALRAEVGALRYAAVDVSRAALEEATEGLRAWGGDWLEVEGVVADFTRGLDRLPRRHPGLVAFLGSTIGNFAPDEQVAFLAEVASCLAADDAFLLGLDLVKDPAALVLAYDDPDGVTAAFDLNVLDVLRRELDAEIPDVFAHEARWVPEHERIEMHLVAAEDAVLRLPSQDLEVPIAAGESIRTELSSKFTRPRAERLFAEAGLRLERWDADRAGFALALLRRA